MLDFYARRFNAVETHSTYRRLPTVEGVEHWRSQVSPDFRFAPKVHLSITHRRDLDGIDERVFAFLSAVAPLGAHLGPLLFSLPHQTPDLERLDRLLAALAAWPAPVARSVPAFELGPEWAIPPVVDRLEAAGATLVQNDVDRRRPLVLNIGPIAYVRLRRDNYNRSELDAWAERLDKVRADGRDAYVFFKHDDRGDGPRYARRLLGRLSAL